MLSLSGLETLGPFHKRPFLWGKCIVNSIVKQTLVMKGEMKISTRSQDIINILSIGQNLQTIDDFEDCSRGEIC